MTYVKQTWANGALGGTPISAARLAYIESGIESVDNKFAGRRLSVLDPEVGCQMDGSDETSLVNAAIASGAKELFIPAGTLRANILINRNDITLSGEGASSIIRAASGNTVIAIGDGLATRSDITLRDITIDGQSTSGRSGIKTLEVARFNLLNVQIRNTPYAGLWLGGTIGTTQVYVFGCNINTVGSGGPGTTGWGVLAEDNSNAITLVATDFLNCVQGAVKATNCYSFKIIGGAIQACGVGGTEPYGVHFIGGADIQINTYFEATSVGAPLAGSADIFLEKNGGTYLESARISGYIFGSAVCEYGVKMDGVRNVRIEDGTTIYGHAVSELYLSANVASEGVDAGKPRMPAPVVAKKSGAGAASITLRLAGETEQLPMGVVFQAARSDNKVSTSYSVGGNALPLDCALGNIQKVTLSASMGAAATTLNNPTDGQTVTLTFIQDATGSRTYNWPVACKFNRGAAAPANLTAAGAIDTATFWYDGATGNFIQK